MEERGGDKQRETARQVAFYSRRGCGQAVTNHRFPFRYSRHFIGRTRSPARTKGGAAEAHFLWAGPTSHSDLSPS